MRTRAPLPKPLTHTAGKRVVPLWLALSLAAAIGLLIYGAVRPKPPSAFDLPEAQTNIKARNPWDGVR